MKKNHILKDYDHTPLRISGLIIMIAINVHIINVMILNIVA